MANKIQIRRDTGANWTLYNPVLAQGEIGIVTDVTPTQMKIGNGTTAWNSLVYLATGTMDIGSSTLDDLADGTTYKKLITAVATALNAGTFSLDSVADGSTYKKVIATSATNINAVTPTQAGITDANAIAAATGATLAARLVGLVGPTIADGQPPAPKPTYSTSLSAIGNFFVGDYASGALITIPGTAGSIFWFVLEYGVSISGQKADVSNAGASWGTVNANTRIFWWRIA